MSYFFQSECSRLKVYKSSGGCCAVDTEEEIIQGLTCDRKYILSKYFYDSNGSKLFEEICRLPEYYQTRTELSILKQYGEEIMSGFTEGDMVELGSGANWKVRALLDSLHDSWRGSVRYIPVDISHTALIEASEEMLDIYPELDIVGIVTDFTRELEMLDHSRRKMFLFLGSTIGNLDEEEANEFLSLVAENMGSEDRLLLGLDMLKPVDILEAAYDDSQGVTARFNKNALHVINDRINADFDMNDFEHLAFFNEDEERVEMHLRALKNIEVMLGAADMTVQIEKGETIHTEICRKYSVSSGSKMFEEAGLVAEEWYTDPKGWFSLVMLKRNSA